MKVLYVPYNINLDYADGTDGGGFYESGSADLSLYMKDSAASTKVSIVTAGNSYFNGGNVGIGTSSPSAPLDVNRLTSDGVIANFRKDGVTVGSIGTYSGRLCIGEGDVGLRFADDFDQIAPFNPTTGAIRDNAINLGADVNRFKNLYLSGGVYLGGTGAANKLDDYEEGSWTPAISGASGFSDASIGSIDAKYTKVGRLVTLSFEFVLTSSTGYVAVDDSIILSSTCLPFTPTYNGHSAGVCGIQGAIATGGDTAMGYIGISGVDTVAMIIHSVKGSASRGTGVVGGTFSYETNS